MKLIKLRYDKETDYWYTPKYLEIQTTKLLGCILYKKKVWKGLPHRDAFFMNACYIYQRVENLDIAWILHGLALVDKLKKQGDPW